MDIVSHILPAIVAIGIQKYEDETHWAGSGFLYGYPRGNDRIMPLVVTNKHVVETGAAENVVRFNPAPGNAPVDDSSSVLQFIGHPTPEVDIAVAPIRYEELKKKGAEISTISDNDVASIQEMQEHNISEGDDVFVVGFPLGMVLSNHAPIVRSGTIARVRDCYGRDRPTSFVLDVFVFPGNSGGPVILK